MRCMAQEVADHSVLPCGDPSEQTATALHPPGIAVERALGQASYDVLPLRTAEESIIGAVPRDVSLTVTMTASKGVEPTIDLTERLVAHGHLVTPHLAARMFRDRAHLADTMPASATTESPAHL
jgi:methylenetetrahydrofolate reductase (NADPH)